MKCWEKYRGQVREEKKKHHPEIELEVWRPSGIAVLVWSTHRKSSTCVFKWQKCNQMTGFYLPQDRSAGSVDCVVRGPLASVQQFLCAGMSLLHMPKDANRTSGQRGFKTDWKQSLPDKKTKQSQKAVCVFMKATLGVSSA